MPGRRFQLLLAGWCVLQVAAARAETHHLVRFIKPGQYLGYGLETMRFSPDGSTLAISTTNKVVTFLDPPTAKRKGEFQHQTFSMAFSRDGSKLLLIGYKKVSQLDMRTGLSKEVGFQVEKGSLGITLGHTSGRLVIKGLTPGGPAAESGQIAVGDELVAVGPGRGGKFLKTIGDTIKEATEKISGRPGEYVRLKVVPQATIEDRVVLLRRAARTPTGFAAFTPPRIDDNLAWCLSDNNHALYDARTGKLASSFRLQDLENNRGWHAISPDRQRFAFLGLMHGTHHPKRFSIEVFDLPSRERVAFYQDIESRNGRQAVAVDAFWGFHYTPDGKELLVGNRKNIQVLDAKTGEHRRDIPIPEGETGSGGRPGRHETGYPLVKEFALSSKGLLAAGDPWGTVRLVNYYTGEYLRTLPKREEDDDGTQGILFSPSGDWLAYYNNDRLHLVDVSGDTPDPADADKVVATTAGVDGESAESTDAADPSNGDESPDEPKDATPTATKHSAESMPEDSPTSFAAGDEVDVEWKGSWYKAVVLSVEGESEWRIHYDGYGDNWDENVGPKRIRKRKP